MYKYDYNIIVITNCTKAPATLVWYMNACAWIPDPAHMLLLKCMHAACDVLLVRA